MRSFRHGRVLFAGDAAHLVSPFGARGANSGVQDIDNLAWKLALVIAGLAPERLLDSYDAERTLAAEENIRHSTRSTDFITPKSGMSRTFRDAVLMLAKRHPFARKMVNSGRLSLPAILVDSPLNTPDVDAFTAGLVPGSPAADAPVRGDGGSWLLEHLHDGFTLLLFADAGSRLSVGEIDALASGPVPCTIVVVAPSSAELPRPVRRIEDSLGLLARRYDARPGTAYLFRPDQHVCARWRSFDLDLVRDAITRALAQPVRQSPSCSTPHPISPRPTTSIRS
jgi:3-(3-hydroxy-phenyl)propionate hydroxylase